MGRSGHGWCIVGTFAGVVLAAAALAIGAPAASAESPSPVPWWGSTSGSEPTNLHTGETGRIVVTAENRGDAPTSGEVTISDVLPAGLTATGIEGVAGEGVGLSGNRGPVSCTLETLTCTFSGTLNPYEQIEVDISVSVKAGAASGEQNTATVSGGGAAGAVSASHAIEVDGSERFGVEDYELIPENPGGSLDTGAGSHPFQLTSVIALNTAPLEPGSGPRAVALVKDLSPELPAGLIADPLALARCTGARFAADECPADTVVGVLTLTFDAPNTPYGFDTITAPIFNMTPSPGEPARFGARALEVVSVLLEAGLRSGGDYGVTLAAEALTQIERLLSMKLTFWGVPGDPRHDSQRGVGCLEDSGACTPSEEAHPKPFLTLPASCGEPLQSTLMGDSWQQDFEQPSRLYPLASATLPVLGGCNRLPFAPEIAVTPERTQASTPSGFDVDLHVPQESGENPAAVESSAVRDITIALPAGVALNPAGADGLEACSRGQVGFTGWQALDPEIEPGVQTPTFTGKPPEPLEPGMSFCPNGAKLGTVKIKTPISANPLQGTIYLAAQNANPFSSLVAVYVVAKDRESGTLVELPGSVSLNEATGQITVTLQNMPELPFEDIELHFFGEALAPLATPARCGAYTTQASFVPWSTEPGDEAAATVGASSTFDITSGPKTLSEPRGSPCPGQSLPFSPSLTAGTTSLQAGAFSPLTATVSREDGQQALRGLQLRLPPGLSAMLATVPLCPEAQANAGSCTSASEIGQTTVSAGLGGDPYTFTGGRVYLTGPYNGTGSCTPAGALPGGAQSSWAGAQSASSSCAPFGLSIVAPVKAGPLDLENAVENHPSCDCLVIRAKIEVDPQTAQLTITTGSIPTIIDGIPLQIKDFNLTIGGVGGKSNFIFNPTSCNAMSITGTIDGDEGADAPVSASFHVANCQTLKFKPTLTASSEGRAEALKGGGGASLNVKIASRGGPGSSGEEANIKRVDLTLPRLLPARLQPTLQNACRKAQFAKDPAGCPPDSFVGTATAVTPVLGGLGGVAGGGLGGTLIGPAIFVTQGGEAFPDLDLVLQGEGVKILLTGHTDIKGDVTYAKLENFPDAPISSFDLVLPEGPHSALVSGLPRNKHSLCGQSLEMPATIEGQNGAVVSQTTKVSIQGCKPALYVRSTRVSGNSVTLTVTVPSAGHLTVSGRGLIAPSGASKASNSTSSATGATLTVKLHLTTAQTAVLSKSHKLTARGNIAFTPRRGRRLAKSVAVTFS
jgi:uncharacterized repeat protein (TIGR01451 family)